MAEYKKLDISKLNKRINNIISMEEALKDVTPIDIPSDVIEGKRKMVISGAAPLDNNKIGVNINYV